MPRVASLVSSNTDILAALGATSLLVATDDYSDAPGLEHVTRLGKDLEIDVPALAATRPDLVLGSLSVPGMERVIGQVEAAGLPLLILDPVSVPDVLRDIRTVGRALDLPDRAEEAAGRMARELAALRGSYARAPRVVVEWWPRPIIAATRDSWVTDLLAGLGAVNAFADRPGRSAPLHLHEVRDARPDLIVCSWCGARKLRPEVIEARGLGVPVACIPESGLGRPGPRLIEGARALREAMDALKVAPS